MSISSDVKKDIKAAQKIWLPWRILLPWAVVCLLALIASDYFGRLNMALPLLNCVAVFAFITYIKSNLINRVWFWITMAALAILHAWLIWYIPWTSKWVPALAIAVISSADFCMILWILAAVGRLVEGRPPTTGTTA
jgi:hypothetical protein